MINFLCFSFSEETYFAYDTKGNQKLQLFARHGANPHLRPDRRGQLVNGTTCDRVFEGCRLGSCFIQSPGYPGVYPRNQKCRYLVKAPEKYITLHTENVLIDIDGQRCADLILCPTRSVTGQCPYDHVQIYDGGTEHSPLIGIFCGRGKFPYAIIGSGKELLLVFVSSPAGPLLSTGFSFEAGFLSKWFGSGATIDNGSCDAVFHSSSKLSESDRRFHSLSTWYPPNTRCSFTILGEPNEVIRLRFKTFRVSEQKHGIRPSGECSETLTIYDSNTRDDTKLITSFCDTGSPPAADIGDFVSSGPAMYVQFISSSGSYFGSSLDYWILFDFFNAFRYGAPVDNTQCDEMFTATTMTTSSASLPISFLTSSLPPSSSSSPSSQQLASSSEGASSTTSALSSSSSSMPSPTMTFLRHGIFSSPLNNLVFLKKQRLTCKYRFDAAETNSAYSRVLLTFLVINFTQSTTQQQCISCLDDAVDKILITDLKENNSKQYCICDSSMQQQPMASHPGTSPVTFLSAGPTMEVTLNIDGKNTDKYFSRLNRPVFQGLYEFLHGYGCGRPILDIQRQGELVFPDPTDDYYFDQQRQQQQQQQHGGLNDGAPKAALPIRCIWTMEVSMRKNVYLRFEHVDIDKNCSIDRIEIQIPNKKHSYGRDVNHVICGSEFETEFPLIESTSLTANRILVEFRSLHVTQQNFKLVWTELSNVENQHKFASKAAASTDCHFVCKGSNACIPKDLVCNGVRNCPIIGTNVASLSSAGAATATDAAVNTASSDEDSNLCRREETTINWLAIGLGAAGGAILASCFVLLIHKCCKKCRHESDPGWPQSVVIKRNKTNEKKFSYAYIYIYILHIYISWHA